MCIFENYMVYIVIFLRLNFGNITNLVVSVEANKTKV